MYSLVQPYRLGALAVEQILLSLRPSLAEAYSRGALLELLSFLPNPSSAYTVSSQGIHVGLQTPQSAIATQAT